MTLHASRRELFAGMLAAGLARPQATMPAAKFVRFRKSNKSAYGILDGDTIREIRGGLFGSHAETGAKYRLSDVKLLCPVPEPSKILALAGNYRSHLGKRDAAPHPEIFYKPPSCLQNPEDVIIIPTTATNVHHECELVIVIGKKASNLSLDRAHDVIFGVTCGNDVSEREWQNGPKKDVQWWRAKGADTFGPTGPAVVRGINYGNLGIQCRLNGKVVQKDSTSNLVHDCPTIVSFVSQFVTLFPGDLIFTGTPGTTVKMNPGDIVEVEIEGIGVLRNKVTAESVT